MEEYQNKLTQLQEQQANLMDMQIRVRERLNEARQAQQILLQQENQQENQEENQQEITSNLTTWEGNQASLSDPIHVEQLESETAALRGKLAQLQVKKKHMDQLVTELQAIEAYDRSSSVSFIFNMI